VHLAAKLDDIGVRLYLARVLHNVEDVLQRSGFGEVVGPERFWHSISQCVRAARRDTGLKGNGSATNGEIGAARRPAKPGGVGDEPDEADDVVAWNDDESQATDGDPDDASTRSSF
jgi:hypothetical protein